MGWWFFDGLFGEGLLGEHLVVFIGLISGVRYFNVFVLPVYLWVDSVEPG